MLFRTPVCCTAYESPTKLWLQPRWDGGRELQELTWRVTQWALNQQDRQQSVREGQKGGEAFGLQDLVLVHQEGQQHWFRGKIIASPTKSGPGWQVRLIDFGDCLTLPANTDRLLPMPEVFRQPIAGAVLCKLARISQPGGRGDWNPRDVSRLEALVTLATEDLILEAEIDWLAYKSEDETVPVELYQCSGQSINDIFGQRSNSLAGKRSARSGVSWRTNNTWQSALKTAAPIEAPDNSWKPFEGWISHVTDRGVVFVQSNAKQLSDLQDHLQFLRESDNLHRFSAASRPEKDEIFAVFQKQPLCHYRGRVLENLGEEARLLIIDFGFEMTVSWEQCARIPSRIRYEPQCRAFVPAGLDRLPPDASLGTLWLASGTEAKSGKVYVSPNPKASGPEVQVADITLKLGENNRQDLVDFLLNADGEKNKTKEVDRKPLPLSISYRSVATEVNWDVDNIVCGTCTHVEDGATFAYIRPNTMHDQSEQVQTLLDLLAPSLQSAQLGRPKQGQLEAAKTAEPLAVLVDSEGRLQRASVDRCDKSALICDVTLVDTGERVRGVAMTKVYAVTEELLKLPASCVKCQLVENSGQKLRAGASCIFTIVGIVKGAYQISVLQYNAQT